MRHVSILVFALGALAALGVLQFRPRLESRIGMGSGLQLQLVDAFLVTACTEEAFKLLACLLGAFLGRRLRHPGEGLIYGIAVALGFASTENVLYLVQTSRPEIVLFRACSATLAHVGFTGSLMYAIALVRFNGRLSSWMIPASFVGAVVLHGTYDLLLWQGPQTNWMALMIVLPLTLACLTIKWQGLDDQTPKSKFHVRARHPQTPSSQTRRQPTETHPMQRR